MSDACGFCGGPTTEALEEQTFQYGQDPDGVMLTVTVPVMRCAACDEAWTDWRGEEERAHAVQQHLLQKATSNV